MKKKLFAIGAAMLLLVIGTAAFFLDSLAIWVAPKTVLSGAIYTAAEDLQQRWLRSPVSMLAACWNPEGQYAGHLDLNGENQLLGSVSYHMDIQADIVNNRILAEGIVRTQQNGLDLALYLDRDYMAVSSEGFLKGEYYGITYNTFSQDIRSIPLISMFINQDILAGWEASVENVQTVMNRSYQPPQLPQMKPEELRQALTAVLLLPGRVERDQIMVNGVVRGCRRVDYNANGEQVLSVLADLMDTGDGSDARIAASFWIWEDQLVKVSLQGQAGGNSIRCVLELLCGEDTVTVRLSRQEGAEENGFCLEYYASEENGMLREAWTLSDQFDGGENERRFAYSWEPESGQLILDGEGSPRVTISKTEEGIVLHTEDLKSLWQNVSEKSVPGELSYCEVTINHGQGITPPEYKNLDRWSLEDLLVLLGGIGGLFGLDR